MISAYLFLAILIIYAIGCVWLLFLGIDFFISKIRKVAPEVPSCKRSRDAVLGEIARNYSDMQSVLDIGCCYGGLARKIAARFPKMSVVGIECMPMPYVVAQMSKVFCPRRNIRFVFGDAFRFIKKSDGFDIGIAYLLTPMMRQVEEVADKFKVLLVLDFPLPGRVPARVTKLHKDMLGQHVLYVYENKNN
ncbi:MAG: class I SAM-dependent methyltransferase [Alphaproteobacteria bacterium]|nr:class I SAM-dependent methyltransferase [Alphaproteobacteria bacterium]